MGFIKKQLRISQPWTNAYFNWIINKNIKTIKLFL